MKRFLALFMVIVMSISIFSVSAQAMDVSLIDRRWGQMFLSNDKFTSFQGTTTLYGDYDYLNFDIRSDYSGIYFFFSIFSDKECTNLLYSDYTYCGIGQHRYSPCIKLKGVFKTGTYYLVTYSAKEVSSTEIAVSTTMIDYEIKVNRTTDFTKQIVVVNGVENTVAGPRVTWQKVSSQATQYIIYRRHLNGTAWTKVGTVDGATTSFVDESVKDINGKYVYTVRAVDKNGKNTRFIFNGPSALYCKTPTVSSVTAIANNRIQVEWDSVANGASYWVYRKTNGGEWKLLTQYCSSTKYEDYNVESGNTYEYTVRAALHTTDGVALSDYKEGKSIYYVGVPHITNVSAQDNAIRVDWDATAGATAYTIYRRPYDLSEGWVSLGQVSADTLSFVDNTADLNCSYRYTIRSESGDVRGSFSSTGTPYIVFAKQQVEVVQSPDKNEMIISWTQDSQAKGYELYSRENGGEWKLFTTTRDTSYKTYPTTIREKEFKVRSYWKEYDSSKEVLYSEFSDVVSVTIIPGVVIDYDAYTDGIELFWGERGAESYNVYRKLASDEVGKYVLIASTNENGYKDTSIERGVKYSYQVRLVYKGEEQQVRLFDNYAGVSVDGTLENPPKIRTYKGTVYFDADDLIIYGYDYQNLCWEEISYKDYLGCKPEEHARYEKDGKHRYGFSAVKDGMKTPIDENVIDYEWFLKTIDYTVDQRADYVIITFKNIPPEVTKCEFWNHSTTTIRMDGSESYSVKYYGYSSDVKENFSITAYTENGDVSETKGFFVRLWVPEMYEAEKLSNGGNKLTIRYSSGMPEKNVDGYYIYRRAVGESKWIKIDTINASTVSKNTYYYTTYIDNNVDAGVTYQYTARGYNIHEGTVSVSYFNTKGITIGNLDTPKLKSIKDTSSGFQVNWQAVSGADGYYVYRKTANSGWSRIARVTGNTYVDKTVKAGTRYYYTVKAYKGSVKSAHNATGISIIRLATPALKTVANSSSGITVKWSKVTGANGYYVYRKTANSGWSKVGTIKNGSTVSFTDKTAKNGVTYIYTVKAFDGRDASGYNKTGLSIKRLATPSLNSATRSTSGVTVKWSKVTGANGYYVYRKTENSGWSRVGTIKNGSTVAFADKTAKKGTTYYYTVKAYSGSNTSAYNTTGIKCK